MPLTFKRANDVNAITAATKQTPLLVAHVASDAGVSWSRLRSLGS